MGFFDKIFGINNGTTIAPGPTGIRMPSRAVDIGLSLGSTIACGNARAGKERLLTDYVIDALNNDSAVIMFRDVSSGFSPYPRIINAYSGILSINSTEYAATDGLDPFANYSESDAANETVKIFSTLSEVDKSKKVIYQNYISIIRSLLKENGKKFKLNELSEYTLEDFDRMNSVSRMPQTQKMRNDGFLNKLRGGDAYEIESYFDLFKDNNLGDILSGDMSLETVFRSKYLIDVALDFAADENACVAVITAILDAASKMKLATTKKTSVTITTDNVPNDALQQCGIIKFLDRANFNVFINVTDISNLVKENNLWAEKVNSYFFLKQNSNENKEYCSAIFGEYEKNEVSRSESVSKPNLFSIVTGRGTTSTTTGINTQIVKKRVFPPEKFANMPENRAIYYIKNTNNTGEIQL